MLIHSDADSEPNHELDIFELRTLAALEYGAKVGLPMLNWLQHTTENSKIRERIELPRTRRDISRIIGGYFSSTFFAQFQAGIATRQITTRRTESALQIAERQMDTPIAGYYSRAHPEIAALIGEDWGADHTDNLRRTSASHDHVISDPGSFYLEVITPELVILWIMEDLQIAKAEALEILSNPLAAAYGRLVLEAPCVEDQEQHSSLAHSRSWVVEEVLQGRRGRNWRLPNRH